MIDITKKYRTRDGREVAGLEHYDNDPYVFAGYAGGNWATWTPTGAHWEGTESGIDLIEVNERQDTELAELRAFRDAAIAKYPDLAPVDPIEVKVARIYGEWDGDDVTHAIRATLLRGIEIGKGGVA